ncbi:MAG: DNA-binding domain-containing protein, partial [Pseudomonadota bacterium]|nr:DNA-binding domain-containing protein [Pseudomonadota bacterium]
MSHEKDSLLELQQQFIRLLVNGDRQIQSRIIGTQKVPVETRLGIYADAYRFRLIDALADSYPSVHTLLGDDDFIVLANAYIDHCPSQHFSIRWFGHQLPTFLQQTAPYSGSPALREMALFEWTLRDVFDAQDFTPLTMDDLRQLPAERWSDLRLQFNPTIQRIELSWNVPALWQEIDKQLDPSEAISYDYPL